MTQPITLNIKTAYSMAFHAPAILGAGYANALVQALLDYESAQQLQDVDGLHAQVLPLLPAGTPADAALLTYAKLRVGDEVRVIALDWLASQPTVVSTDSVTVVVKCPPERRALLASALRQNGFIEFTIS